MYTETSSLRTLKIMPRNLDKIVHSWIRLQVRDLVQVHTVVGTVKAKAGCGVGGGDWVKIKVQRLMQRGDQANYGLRISRENLACFAVSETFPTPNPPSAEKVIMATPFPLSQSFFSLWGKCRFFIQRRQKAWYYLLILVTRTLQYWARVSNK